MGTTVPAAPPARRACPPRAPYSTLGGQHHAGPQRYPGPQEGGAARTRQAPASLSWRCCTVLAEDADTPGPCFLSIGEPSKPLARQGVPRAGCWGPGWESTSPLLCSCTPGGGGDSPRSSSGVEPHIQPQDKIPQPHNSPSSSSAKNTPRGQHAISPLHGHCFIP